MPTSTVPTCRIPRILGLLQETLGYVLLKYTTRLYFSQGMLACLVAALALAQPRRCPRSSSLRMTVRPTDVSGALHLRGLHGRDIDAPERVLGWWWRNKTLTTVMAKQLKDGIVQVHDFLDVDVASALANELQSSDEWESFEDHRYRTSF